MADGTNPLEMLPEDVLKGGKISIINDVLFIVPDDSETVKKIVYANGYYYILLTNGYLYKLDEHFDSIGKMTLINLFEDQNNVDYDSTDINCVDGLLVISANGKFYTDFESLNAYKGVIQEDLIINTTQVNTKTVVKITLK